MSRLAAIQTMKAPDTARIVIYGIEGVGKTSFGAAAPKSIIITPEGGAKYIDGAKVMPRIHTFADVVEGVQELITAKHEYKSLVIDSSDWLEKLAHLQIIGKGSRDIIRANGGYGAGYAESERMHKELVDLLTTLHESKNMNVIVTGHYHVKTVKDPDVMDDYDSYDLKCHDKVGSLWREWADALLFARFRTYIKKDEDTQSGGRAVGAGERVMYTQQRPAFKAKNRLGLPFEINDVSWKAFDDARKAAIPDTDLETLKKDLLDLYKRLPDDETRSKAMTTISDAGTDLNRLIAIRNRMRAIALPERASA